MLVDMIAWLDRVGPMVFWGALVAFLAVNGVAALMFTTRKSRDAVNRWTAPLLAANLLLVGAGTAVPATFYVAKVALVAMAPSAPSLDVTAN